MKISAWCSCIAAWLVLSGAAYPEENLRREREKLSHAVFIGGALTPLVTVDAGRRDTAGSGQKMVWHGTGFELNAMYITGVYMYDEDAHAYLGVSCAAGYTRWEDRVIFDADDKIIVDERINKGDSYHCSAKIRGSSLLWRTFGLYFDAGLIADYFLPVNVAEDESIERGFRFGVSTGMGISLIFPFENAVELDAGFDLINLMNGNRYGNRDDMLMLRVSVSYEVY